MRGADVYRVLQSKGVYFLHHANTVLTSCTFLEQGGLASRGYVEMRRLRQTAHYSDADDKRYGIWHDVFIDGVDVHSRASRRNFYGPVLFVLPAEILLHVLQGTDVMVMKKNPVNWKQGELQSDRYLMSVEESLRTTVELHVDTQHGLL